MSGRTSYILRTLFVAYVTTTIAHIVYVVSREPFAFDAWNVAVDSGAEPITIGRFFAFWKSQYLSSNPRIGQPLAYLAYKLVGFGEVGTTLAFLSSAVAAFVIGNGRFPSWKRGFDLALLTVAIGFLWFVVPEIGSLMFCRAYSTNYLWAASFQLWFVAALRLLARRATATTSSREVAGCAVLGLVAGMSNEHTGPTLLIFAAAMSWWTWKRDHRWSQPIVAGLVGAVVGFLIIFFAPGQGQRYDGLAQRLSLKERLLARGISANLDIFEDLLYAAGPLLVILMLAIILGSLSKADDDHEGRRERWAASLRVLGLAISAGMLITMTVFVSPKLGSRFYMHSMLLVLAAFLGVLNAYLNSARTIAPFIVLAVLSSIYAAARTVPLYTRLDRESDHRIAGLVATPRDGVYTAESWEQVPGSWWFLGDDFRDQKKRELVSRYFDIKRVVFRGLNQFAALGVSDVRLYTNYEFDREICIDEQASIMIDPYIGRDVPAIHHAFLDAVAEVSESNVGRLLSMDLLATFQGEAPPMPRDKLYVARWSRDAFEGYIAKVSRIGRTTEREILPEAKLSQLSGELYLVAIGDSPRKLGPIKSEKPYRYVPWRTGTYWVLACDTAACWVVTAIHHRI